MKDKIIDSVKDHLRKDIFISNFAIKNSEKEKITKRKISNKRSTT